MLTRIASPEAPQAAPAPPTAVPQGASNHALARMLAREPAAPQTVQPPQESPAPAKITAIQHEGQFIAGSVEGCYEAILRVAGTRGAPAAGAWASRFYNMGALERATAEAQYGAELVSATATALQQAETQFDDACKQFLMVFETRAGNVADEMLTTSEGRITEEQQRLGLDRSQFGHGADSDQVAKLQAAAALLLAKRREVDALAQAAVDAQPKTRDPFGLDRTAIERAAAARKAWSDGEHAYDELARAQTAPQPVLAMWTTGGNAAAKLASVTGGAEDQQFLVYRLQHDLEEKLANIKTVRGALGGRFKPLKQPPVVRMAKDALAAEPWQRRLVDDHVKEIEAAEADSKLMWTVLAIGLGLLAAIPSAGVGAVAAAGAAGVSAYRAYDELEEAQLQDAAAGTDFDKAHAISESEPDFFWLALDIVGAIADVVAAGAAFSALRASMKGVKATEVASLQKLASECEAARLSPTNRGRVFAAALGEAGGEMTVTLEQMLDVFRKLVPPPGEEKWVEYAHEMAEYMVSEGKVITMGPGRELEDVTAWFKAKDHTLSDSAARGFANDVLRDMEGKTGAYKPRQDLVIMRTAGTPESVASVFVHEITHQRQKLMKVIGKMTDMERELSAFSAQRDFLKLVPLEALPERYHWLRAATDDEIYFHVYRAYGMNVQSGSKVSDTWMAMLQALKTG